MNYDTHDTERLIDVFHETCCRTWSRDAVAKNKLVRFAQAYLMMAGARYRPGAPSDGFGNIHLDKAQMADKYRLYQEAVEYAAKFCTEEDDREFWIGCSNYTTNRAFVLCIEAARLLAGGAEGDPYAVKLLSLAVSEINSA